jgi:uncharacterized protein YkwD
MHYLCSLALLLFLNIESTGTTGQLIELESRVFEKVNQYRVSEGLPPMEMTALLVLEARKHSAAMAAGRVPFGHEGFRERVRNAGTPYQAAAENVALNKGVKDPANQAVQGWIKSNGHRSNMEGDYNLTGIGIAQARDGTYYFTQLFLRSRSSR